MIYSLRMMDGREHSFGEEHSPIDCFCCGYCCIGYNPMVTEGEIERMAGHLSLSPVEFKDRYIDETLIGYLVRQTETGCVFLNWKKDLAKGYCDIHPARPDACRDWVPSLWRQECCEGLARLGGRNGRILPAKEVYEDGEQLQNFTRRLRRAEAAD